MTHKIPRGLPTLSKRVFNTPQLIVTSDLQAIAEYLVKRASGDITESTKAKEADAPKVDYALLSADEKTKYRRQQLGITEDGKRGNLNVTGTLVYKAGQIDADCMELTSYEKLVATAKAQINEGVDEILMYVDTGGGEAYSCFESAKEVRGGR